MGTNAVSAITGAIGLLTGVTFVVALRLTQIRDHLATIARAAQEQAAKRGL